MFNTQILLSRELWSIVDSVMRSCCSHIAAVVE